MHKIASEKKVVHLISDTGPKIYTVLKSLMAPTLPAECELRMIKEVLVQHYKPTPLIIAEHLFSQVRPTTGRESQRFHD